MIVGFDMDGTLDRPAILQLAIALDAAGHDVHVISGMFPEDEAPWQNEEAKWDKFDKYLRLTNIKFHIVRALPVSATKNLDYVLRDLNLNKANLLRTLGIELYIDDSSYTPVMKGMCGTQLLQVL